MGRWDQSLTAGLETEMSRKKGKEVVYESHPQSVALTETFTRINDSCVSKSMSIIKQAVTQWLSQLLQYSCICTVNYRCLWQRHPNLHIRPINSSDSWSQETKGVCQWVQCCCPSFIINAYAILFFWTWASLQCCREQCNEKELHLHPLSQHTAAHTLMVKRPGIMTSFNTYCW